MLVGSSRSKVVLIGDGGTGKSQLLPRGTCANSNRDISTAGAQFEREEFSVTLDPKRPHGDGEVPVQLTCWEIGCGGGRAKNKDVTPEHILSRKGHSNYNAVVLVFSAVSIETYANVWKRWAPLFSDLTRNSQTEPFPVFVETHCDKVTPDRRVRHRRVVEIDCYMTCGPAFIFCQLDAHSAVQCNIMWEQISVQLRHQRKKPGGSITIIHQPEPPWFERLKESIEALTSRFRTRGESVDLSDDDFFRL